MTSNPRVIAPATTPTSSTHPLTPSFDRRTR
jgi:hypothetical protein